MTLESSKTLGGVGALLIVVSVLGFLGSIYSGLLSLIGIILVLVALKGLSDHYNEGAIFNNALYGVVLTIVGFVVFAAVAVALVFMVIAGGFNWEDWSSFGQYFTDINALMNVIGTIIIALVVLFVFLVISAIYFRKSLSALSARSGVNIFETAGLLWLIGAVLTVIIVGFLLIWVAWILITVGFFSIKTTSPSPIAEAAAQPTPAS